MAMMRLPAVWANNLVALADAAALGDHDVRHRDVHRSARRPVRRQGARRRRLRDRHRRDAMLALAHHQQWRIYVSNAIQGVGFCLVFAALAGCLVLAALAGLLTPSAGFGPFGGLAGSATIFGDERFTGTDSCNNQITGRYRLPRHHSRHRRASRLRNPWRGHLDENRHLGELQPLQCRRGCAIVAGESCDIVARHMMVKVGGWLEPLRTMRHSDCLRISSELAPEELLQRIADGLSGSIIWPIGRRGNAGEWTVRGFVYQDFVSVRAISRRLPRNDWRPQFTGRVTASPSGGAELSGTLGVPKTTIVITIIYLISCATVTAISFIGGRGIWAKFPLAQLR